MSIFHCRNCNLDFEIHDPQKKEYMDPVYGYCWKYIAFCPECEAECSEKPKPKPGKKEQNSVREFPRGGCCPGSGCCGV